MENKKEKLKEIASNIFPVFFKRKKNIGIFSLFAYRLRNEYAKEDMDKHIIINEKRHEVKTIFKRGIKLLKFKGYTYYLNLYKVTFDMEFLKHVQYKME